ncbi:MAG: beta-ketoacyl synthase chain length factor [Rhodospirillales bacterium]|nr:beta-ketoacyl synthase chain length factor [Rhodospirillales bacterium]
MNAQNSIELVVSRWSAWAPGLTDQAAWREWASGRREIEGPVKPDVKFVDAMMRRRLSSLTRMAFRVAADCLSDEDSSPVHIFCSRYGEYNRTFGILSELSKGEPASAAAFSMSVHNTAASLFSIDRHDTSISTSLAGGEATPETAFVEAWTFLTSGEASSALVVYHDEPLPEIYRRQITTVAHPAAFALVLRLPDTERDAFRLSLNWDGNRLSAKTANSPSDPALQVLRMMLAGGGPVRVDTGRLVWEWSQNSATD